MDAHLEFHNDFFFFFLFIYSPPLSSTPDYIPMFHYNGNLEVIFLQLTAPHLLVE